jgi:N6-L-threonylcarbamoyladenine synthase
MSGTAMRVLALESSCDETSAAVVSGTAAAPRLESLVILSQDVHRIFGGVVPEIASREHLTAIVPVTRQVMSDARCQMSEIDAVAVTHAPGLVGA